MHHQYTIERSRSSDETTLLNKTYFCWLQDGRRQYRGCCRCGRRKLLHILKYTKNGHTGGNRRCISSSQSYLSSRQAFRSRAQRRC
ncbi:hypothetical protein B566_EDAN008289 [Ephemera danica]|nr:hypothetical protein B566_EDAN008289 [Ephemera danica]